MTPKSPVLDIYIGRDGERWRLHVAPMSWLPGVVRRHMNERREVFPVAKPDAADLDAFMFAMDAPYERRLTADGGLEIQASGRSAIVLHEWIADLVGARENE